MPGAADVVVIGGGVAGCATAYQLAKRGLSVVLFEMRGICSGASGRNGGLTGGQTLVPTDTGRAVHALSQANLRLLRDELPSELGEDFDLRVDGLLDIATTDDQWAHIQHAQAVAASDEVVLLHRDDLRELMPVIGPEVRGASLNRMGGHLWPFALVHGLARGARQHGARVMPWTPVEQVEIIGGRVRGVQTAAGSVATDCVVVATNAWTPKVVPDLPQGAIVPARGQILVTQPVGPVLPLPFGLNYEKEYGRQTVTGQLLCGGYRRLDLDEGLGHYEERVTPDVINGIAGCLAGLAPTVSQVRIVRTWAGIMGFTADGLPLIGRHAAADGLHIIAGFNGGGFSFAVAGGAALAQMIAGEAVPFGLQPFDPNRFSGPTVSWNNPFTAGEKSNPRSFDESGAIRREAAADC
ncbi:MAG: FAD-binding oxidoreductase [Thermomicrobiales bacterium]|nr:FAD-binding oxidoreductase [Thermomicrobiales bacterium]